MPEPSSAAIAQATEILAKAPCSIEMPAGTGKTHLLAAAVYCASTQGSRSLILTHTNAGVDAMRKRLKSFGVSSSWFHIDTITSWAFSLVRSYPQIAGLIVGDDPDWSLSSEYIEAATRVANSSALRTVHAVSFDYLFVDEYQDCVIKQHEFIRSISRAIPESILFGDPLQGIFGFRDNVLVDWPTLTKEFPPHLVDFTPHRWTDHNLDLGNWLLEVRKLIATGTIIDFSRVSIPGVTWIRKSNSSLRDAVRLLGYPDESILLLDKWAPDVAMAAARLGGSFVVMEEVTGKFMAEALATLPHQGSPMLASWIARHAKNCFVGLSGIDAPFLSSLDNGKTVSHLKREGIDLLQIALDQLIADPTYERLCATAKAFQMCKGIRLYRREGWFDTFSSIERACERDTKPSSELAAIRDRIRRVGRLSHRRVASRTVLVKGLEYDHVIIADAEKLRDPRNFYVALTRARKSITIIGSRPQLRLEDGA